jgi:hypothetical protein
MTVNQPHVCKVGFPSSYILGVSCDKAGVDLRPLRGLLGIAQSECLMAIALCWFNIHG